MFDKFGLIDGIITLMDEIADAKGIGRCIKLVDAVQRLSALEEGLKNEDKAHELEKGTLEEQIKNLMTANMQDGDIIEGGQKIDLMEALN